MTGFNTLLTWFNLNIFPLRCRDLPDQYSWIFFKTPEILAIDSWFESDGVGNSVGNTQQRLEHGVGNTVDMVLVTPVCMVAKL